MSPEQRTHGIRRLDCFRIRCSPTLQHHYLLSNRFFGGLHGGALILFKDFWMGLLPESVYDAISEKSYGEGKLYMNASYPDQGERIFLQVAVSW
jgi:hypothetical protein